MASNLGGFFEALSVEIEGKRRKALHQRLYDELRDAVLSGRLVKGSRIPSSRVFADTIGISRNTVNVAVQRLCAEGFLVARHGSGTFVTDAVAATRSRRSTAPTEPLRRADLPIAPRRVANLAYASAALDNLRHMYDSDPRPFRIAVPELSDFPWVAWRRIVSRALRRIPQRAHGAGDPAGLHQLRAVVAEYLGAHRGISCGPEQVVITAGSQQAIDLVVRVTTSPGDLVWMEDPGYIGATGSFRCAGLRLRSMPVDEDGLRLPSRSVGKAPRLIYCTPSSQMPLGVPLAYARREALVSFAEEASSWILEDDYDGEYRYDTRPLPTLFGLSRSARVIYMGTFSKTMFPGLRIGYLVLPHTLVEPIVAMKFVSSWQSATLEQYSLADFIDTGEFARHVRRCRKLYAARAEEIYVAGQKWLPPSHRLLRPRSGLSAILAAPADEDHEHVIQSARAAGIELSPLSMFAVGRAVQPGYVLGFAAFDARAIRKAMPVLGGILAASRSGRGDREIARVEPVQAAARGRERR